MDQEKTQATAPQYSLHHFSENVFIICVHIEDVTETKSSIPPCSVKE